MLEMKRTLLTIAAAVSMAALTASAQPGPAAGPGAAAGPMHGSMHGGMHGHGGRGGWALSQLDTNKDGKISKDEMTAQFDRLDTNKDGALSQEELAAARAQYAGRQHHARFDANGDGLISRDEAKGAPGLTTNFDAIDTSKDGSLSADEMRAFHATRHAQGPGVHDANKDGLISRDEAKNAPRLSADFDALDANKDGQLSREELRSAWAGRRHQHGPRLDAN